MNSLNNMKKLNELNSFVHLKSYSPWHLKSPIDTYIQPEDATNYIFC